MNLSYNNRGLTQIFFLLPQFARELIAVIYSYKVHNRRFGGAFSGQMERLQGNKTLSAEERARDQFSSLKDILIYANADVEYYGNLFKQIGFDPQSMRSLDDLQHIPLLGRDALRSSGNNLRSRSFTGSTFVHHTSGTTGMALEFLLSAEANQRHYGCMWHHYGWAGVKRKDPIATFGYHPVAHGDSKKPPFWLYDRVENELFFSIQHISSHTAPLYIQALVDFKPAMIRGVPSFLNLIAQYMMETGKTYHPKAIEQAFGCRVYNFYSNGERTGHVLQCEQGNLHVLTETSVLEVLRPDGKPAAVGEVGELVITNLINRAMPLIRYRIGDTAIMGEGGCACGRETPILQSLTGRTNDFIVTTDNRKVHPRIVFGGDMTKVIEAQFVQEKIGSVVVKIVPRQDFGPADEKLLMDDLKWDLGSAVDVQLQIVDEIARTKSGKFQHIVSRISA